MDPTKLVLSWSTSALLPWTTTLRLLDLLFFDPVYQYYIGVALVRLSKSFVLEKGRTHAQVSNFFQNLPNNLVMAENVVNAVVALAIKEEKLIKMKTKAELLVPLSSASEK